MRKKNFYESLPAFRYFRNLCEDAEVPPGA